MKTLYTLLLLFWANYSFGQGYTATLLTKVAKNDTNRILYVQNQTGDTLAVYNITGGVVDAATIYCVSIINKKTYLIAQPTYTGQQSADSLDITFNDTSQTVLINSHDRYRLYPAFYTQFKQAVAKKRSVIAALKLLQDGIGDYPVDDALPLLLFAFQKGKHIQQATITTARSQSDLTDTWKGVYRYNKSGNLDSVSATDGKVMRLSKKISYESNHVRMIRTYSNLEDRQVTERLIIYTTVNILKWQDIIVETGKNLQTVISYAMSKKSLGHVKQIVMPQVEVMRLVKSK
jgi:hypothetical protein